MKPFTIDLATCAITLIASMEFGVEFGIYLFLGGIFLRLGNIEETMEGKS